MQGGVRPGAWGERSIGLVPRTPVTTAVAALLAAALLALAPPATGQVAAPAPARPEPREHTVPAQLAALTAAGLLAPATAQRELGRFAAAQRTLAHLGGRRRRELGAVLATLRAVTRGGGLSSGRVPLAFETLERNRQWWSTGALLPRGARVGFPRSELVWQSYPGQGIQVQWLATWGKANGLFTGRTYDARLRALIDEALAYAAPRAGGEAFESWFTFDGGKPPWVSALSAGTALSALSRAALRLHDPALFARARAVLALFTAPPPVGVRLATAAGAHYLQYSFAPGLRVVNGFVQSLNGLHDFGALANDPLGRELFAAGDAELQRELPLADTGAWSRYALGRAESELGYHRLLRDVLRGLCARTGEALACTTAQRFTADLTRPPVVAFEPAAHPAREGGTARVAFTLDKVSEVSLVATRKGRVVAAETARFARGRHAFAVGPLRAAGPVGLRVRAVDLAGNAGASRGVLRVAPRR